MRNFVIAVLAGLVAFGIGMVVGRSWLAGIPTGILMFGVLYFVLARRSFNKLQAILQGAMNAVEGAQGAQDPTAQIHQLDSAMEKLTAGFALSKEQFLMDGIIHAQIGSLQYQAAGVLMQLKLREEIQKRRSEAMRWQRKANLRYASAKEHLDIAHKRDWQTKITRNWQAMGMLAALDVRGNEPSKGIDRLKSVKGPGASDPVYWGMLAWLMHEHGDKTDALLAVSDGVEKNPSSEPLKALAGAIQNQNPLPVEDFGLSWFMFFPEHLTPELAMKLQSQINDKGGANTPMNRQQRRAMKKHRGD